MNATYNDVERPEATGEEDYSPDSLTPQQHAALVALLEYPTVKEAAQAAGVHKATVYKWLGQPAFKSAYRETRREAVTRATARLQQLTGEAAEVLREVMNDAAQQGAARVGAARLVLDYAARMTEAEDLASRVEKLEQGDVVVNRRDLEARIARLEREAKRADVPTPQEYADAHRRHTSRLHEKWAADLGNPGGSLVSEEDRTTLAGDTPEQRRKDEGVIEAWSRGVDLKAAADEARARLLVRRE